MSENSNNTTSRKTLKQRLWGEARHELIETEYDGITAYDNPVPAWITWLIVGLIFVAMPYMVYYHSGSGRDNAANHAAESAANARLLFATMGDLSADEATLVQSLSDKNRLAIGKSVFRQNCVACHGREGGGKVGPNLCDEQFKNIRDITDIYRVIEKGANAGAMPAWKGKLMDNEMILAAAYVASLRGTNPANAKSGEGQGIEPWPTEVKVKEPKAETKSEPAIETEPKTEPETGTEPTEK